MLGTEKVYLSDFLPNNPGSVIGCKKGDFVYSPSVNAGPRIFLVKEGRVFLETCVGEGKKTRKVVFGVVEADEMFGIEAMCGQYITSARCVEQTELMYWSVESLGFLMSRPGFLEVVMGALVDRAASLQIQVERLHMLETKGRLKAFLVDMARKSTEVNDQRMVRIPPFGHGDIAQIIGTTREAVTHLMGELRAEGLISYRMRGRDVWVSTLLEEGPLVAIAISV